MAKKVTTKPKEDNDFLVLENKLDFGFTMNQAAFRNMDDATIARLKKRVERLQARMKKSEDNKK
jgi:hypothetical protein